MSDLIQIKNSWQMTVCLGVAVIVTAVSAIAASCPFDYTRTLCSQYVGPTTPTSCPECNCWWTGDTYTENYLCIEGTWLLYCASVTLSYSMQQHCYIDWTINCPATCGTPYVAAELGWDCDGIDFTQCH